jgi:hypothetical protein
MIYTRNDILDRLALAYIQAVLTAEAEVGQCLWEYLPVQELEEQAVKE